MRGGATTTRLALGVVLIILCLRASAAPAPIALGPGQPQAYAWQADESWPGGSLADARLDEPVRFWRAGLSLPEVLAGIERQTGVATTVWPPTDPAVRMRVTLYLNREQPPTLREVMAQLLWVVDGSFACTGEQPRRYFVLPPPTPSDVMAQLAAEQQQAEQQEEARREREAEANRVKGREALREAVAALDLPADEAARRYAGVSDRMLLTLLDPGRRAALLAVGDIVLSDGMAGIRHSSLWTPEREARLLEAIRLVLPRGWPEEEGERQRFVEAASAWLREGHPFHSQMLSDGSVRVAVPTGIGDDWRVDLVGSPEAPLSADDSDVLEAVLPKAIAPAELTAVQARRREAYTQQRGRLAQEQIDLHTTLSPAARERLSAVSFDWDPNRVPTLWQAQEAVAAATGMNVVSDCFGEPAAYPYGLVVQLEPAFAPLEAAWQAEADRVRAEWEQQSGTKQYDGPAPYTLPPRQPIPISAYYALAAFANQSVDPEVMLWAPGNALGMIEWGDAGSFLRFRTTYRDLWRAGLLPDEVVSLLDARLAPLKGDAQGLAPMPLSLEEQTQLVHLTEAQLLCGGLLVYEDPAAPGSAVRRSRRGEALGAVRAQAPALRLLASLDQSQRESLRAEGLDVRRGLSVAQQLVLMPNAPEALSSTDADGNPRPPMTLRAKTAGGSEEITSLELWEGEMRLAEWPLHGLLIVGVGP